MFKLTKEQIEYIITVYGGSERIIKDIELKLNLLGVIDNEEDYYEVVATVAAQKETILNQIKKCTTKSQIMEKWVSTDKLIKYTLNEKYSNFENATTEVQRKMKSFG